LNLDVDFICRATLYILQNVLCGLYVYWPKGGEDEENATYIHNSVASAFSHAALCAETVLSPESIPRMTKEQLKAQLDNPDFVVVDVRADHDWQDSSSKIKGAIREDPSKLNSWSQKYPENKTIVLYCA
jgi:hypothetical protein